MRTLIYHVLVPGVFIISKCFLRYFGSRHLCCRQFQLTPISDLLEISSVCLFSTPNWGWNLLNGKLLEDFPCFFCLLSRLMSCHCNSPLNTWLKHRGFGRSSFLAQEHLEYHPTQQPHHLALYCQSLYIFQPRGFPDNMQEQKIALFYTETSHSSKLVY